MPISSERVETQWSEMKLNESRIVTVGRRKPQRSRQINDVAHWRCPNRERVTAPDDTAEKKGGDT